MKISLIVVLLGMLAAGCASSEQKLAVDRTLRAPAGTAPQAAAAMEEGDRLFAAKDWPAAKAQYEAAIKAQPSLAEAHYNLAQVLQKMNDRDEAKKHYVEAANLAPGNKVIWNAPPLRKHADPDSPFKKDKDKSFLDPKPY